MAIAPLAEKLEVFRLSLQNIRYYQARKSQRYLTANGTIKLTMHTSVLEKLQEEATISQWSDILNHISRQ